MVQMITALNFWPI